MCQILGVCIYRYAFICTGASLSVIIKGIVWEEVQFYLQFLVVPYVVFIFNLTAPLNIYNIYIHELLLYIVRPCDGVGAGMFAISGV